MFLRHSASLFMIILDGSDQEYGLKVKNIFSFLYDF